MTRFGVDSLMHCMGRWRQCVQGVMIAAAAWSCGQPLEQTARTALTEQVETAHIVFRHGPGDHVDAEWQERFHGWMTSQLDVTLPRPLAYFKYTDRAHLEEVTGRRTNGFATPDTYSLHSIFPADGHEAIHVYTALLGRPSNFFNEGVAVALNSDPDSATLAPQWNGTHVHTHVQLLRRTGQFVGLAGIVTTEGFRDIDEWRGYGEAGSFVLFLVERYGMAPLREFFRSGIRGAAVGVIDARMQAVWGTTLADAEREWLAVVDGWPN